MLIVVVAVAALAFVIGRSVQTPGEQVAKARAPVASLITASVQHIVPRTVAVVRGTLHEAAPQTVNPPESIGADLPIVSAVSVHPGATIASGQLIAAVSGRPVIAMQGVIPAYRTMAVGDSGVDVAELQRVLAAIGLSTGTDPAGYYGPGTAGAVSALYERIGYPTITVSWTPPTAQTATSARAQRRARTERLATVPLGEIAFMRSLPEQIITVANLGQRLGATSALASVGSGRFVLPASTDTATAQLLRVGGYGTALSDFSNGSFAVRLLSKRLTAGGAGSSVPQAHLLFEPVSPGQAAAFSGQALAIKMDTTEHRREWVVPAAAVITNALGDSSIIVLHGSKQVTISVTTRLAYTGREIIDPHGSLAAGEQVVIGTSSQTESPR
jgi:peptidoglycan hydrolase-like protein with peptidoglycan-binding domain